MKEMVHLVYDHQVPILFDNTFGCSQRSIKEVMTLSFFIGPVLLKPDRSAILKTIPRTLSTSQQTIAEAKRLDAKLDL